MWKRLHDPFDSVSNGAFALVDFMRNVHAFFWTRRRQHAALEDRNMTWKTPRVTEVSVAMEINCYVCAKV
jgi:coenzyme PQQ precursor peptide PqqA